MTKLEKYSEYLQAREKARMANEMRMHKLITESILTTDNLASLALVEEFMDLIDRSQRDRRFV
jgi:5'-deoxynucleotidase YfbR-like HD superfamily hydrolase